MAKKNKQNPALKVIVSVVIVALLVVAGLFIAQEGLKKQEVVPTPTPTVSIAPVDTAGWKTYANTRYGYNFKYPSIYAFTAQEGYTPNGQVQILVDNKGSEIVHIIANYDQLVKCNSIETCFVATYGEGKNMKDYIDVTRVIAGKLVHGFGEIYMGNKPETYFVSNGHGNIYLISFSFRISDVTIQPTINGILGSFKFTK